MKLYDVPGYSSPKLLSEEHAEKLGATEHKEQEAPKKSATKAEWAEWAVSQGADEAWADQATRAEVIEQYG